MSDKPAKAKFWVVLPAAGSGSRMQQSVPKQYLSLNGVAVIEHTINLFLANQEIHKLMVCLPHGDQCFSQMASFQEQRVDTTPGGESRAQSVLNGLYALAADDHDWVLVHDAARPCLSSQLLERLIEQLRDDTIGGILAVPARDTLKKSTAEQRVASTVDRADIWQAQTPQMFRYGLLKAAMADAVDQGVETTDEASAIEWSGYQPKLIEGDARNLKITTPEDLQLAGLLLKAQHVQ